MTVLIEPITELDYSDEDITVFGNIFQQNSVSNIKEEIFGNTTISIDESCKVVYSDDDEVEISIGFTGKLKLEKVDHEIHLQLVPFFGKDIKLKYKSKVGVSIQILQDFMDLKPESNTTGKLNGKNVTLSGRKPERFFLNQKKEELRDPRVKKSQRSNKLFVQNTTALKGRKNGKGKPHFVVVSFLNTQCIKCSWVFLFYLNLVLLLL
jgi:hypothetical protein